MLYSTAGWILTRISWFEKVDEVTDARPVHPGDLATDESEVAGKKRLALAIQEDPDRLLGRLFLREEERRARHGTQDRCGHRRREPHYLSLAVHLADPLHDKHVTSPAPRCYRDSARAALAVLGTTPVIGTFRRTAGPERDVVAIDAETGDTRWVWRYGEGPRGEAAPRKNHRGVAYWTDGTAERIVYITPGFNLISLDARTGLPDARFGLEGIVDLYDGLDRPRPRDGAIGSTSPP